jgi:hypothetical protein
MEKGRVSLEGTLVEALMWTHKALDRLGYKVEQGAEMKIEVYAAKGEYNWILHRTGSSLRFKSLYSLARFLIQA